jgi:hypothetical protein
MSNAIAPFLGAFNICMAAVPLTAVIAWMGSVAL